MSDTPTPPAPVAWEPRTEAEREAIIALCRHCYWQGRTDNACDQKDWNVYEKVVPAVVAAGGKWSTYDYVVLSDLMHRLERNAASRIGTTLDKNETEVAFAALSRFQQSERLAKQLEADDSMGVLVGWFVVIDGRGMMTDDKTVADVWQASGHSVSPFRSRIAPSSASVEPFAWQIDHFGNILTTNKASDAQVWRENGYTPTPLYAHPPAPVVACEECKSSSRLIERQTRLLTGVANALKGEPDALLMHSHADLPEVAAAVRFARRTLPSSGGYVCDERGIIPPETVRTMTETDYNHEQAMNALASLIRSHEALRAAPVPPVVTVTDEMVERVAVDVADQWFGPNKYRDAWDDYHRKQWVRVFREALAEWPAITISDTLVEVACRAAHATKVPEHGIEWDYCGSHTQDEWRKAIRAALAAALPQPPVPPVVAEAMAMENALNHIESMAERAERKGYDLNPVDVLEPIRALTAALRPEEVDRG